MITDKRKLSAIAVAFFVTLYTLVLWHAEYPITFVVLLAMLWFIVLVTPAEHRILKAIEFTIVVGGLFILTIVAYIEANFSRLNAMMVARIALIGGFLASTLLMYYYYYERG